MPVGSCPFYFSLRLHSSMRCFFVSYLSSLFLPSGCLFPSPLSLSSWSLWVSYFLFCFRTFLLGSSSALLSVLLSGLFRLWAFTFLARSRVLVPSLLVFSVIDVVGAFVYALSQVVLFLVSRLCPSGSCPSGSVSCCFFYGAVLSFPVFQVFHSLPVSSFLRFLILGIRSLASLSAFFQGCFVVSCPYLASFSCSP